MTGGVSFHIFPPTEKSRSALRRKTSLKAASSASQDSAAKAAAGVQEVSVAIATEIRTPTLDESQLDWPLRSEPEPEPEPKTGGHVEDRPPAQTLSSPVIRHDEAIRAASPAISEATTALSGSPTLVRSNSCATERTATETPTAIRSIFPQYDHSLPLSQQPYMPALPSPTRIPQEKINKRASLFTKHLYPSSAAVNATSKGSSSQPDRWYSTEAQLSQLWDIANGKSNSTTPQTYSLQLHRQEARSKPKSTPRKGSTKATESLKIGQSSLEPFYSLTHSATAAAPIPPGAKNNPLFQNIDRVNNEHEILIHRHHPAKPHSSSSVPIAVLNLTPPPIFPHTERYGYGSNKKDSVVITTIYPKLAALLALDAAAHSPAASEIARLDPKATSPAAVHLAQEAVRETALRECCTLFWEADPAAATAGHYTLHHPVLGSFAVALSGDVAASFDAATASTASTASTTELASTCSSTATAARVEIRAPSTQSLSSSSPSSSYSAQSPATPSSSTSASSTAKPSLFPTIPSAQAATLALPGPLLASIDFATDTLTLNVATILRFSDNAHLLDVLVTTLLAVCVSEAQRAASLAAALAFEGPPTGTGRDSLHDGDKHKTTAKGKKKGVRLSSMIPTATSTTMHSVPGSNPDPNSIPSLNQLITSFSPMGSNISSSDGAITLKDLQNLKDLKELKDFKYLGVFEGKDALGGGGTGTGTGNGNENGTGNGTFRPSEQIDRLPRVTRHVLAGLGVGVTVAMYTVGVAARFAAGTVVVVSECVGSSVGGGGGVSGGGSGGGSGGSSSSSAGNGTGSRSGGGTRNKHAVRRALGAVRR